MMRKSVLSTKIRTSTALVFATVGLVSGGLISGLLRDNLEFTSDFSELFDECHRPNYYNFVWSLRDDFDEDLVDDRWELQYGLDPGNAGDAVLDTDGDGYSNKEEYEGGTDPQSAIYNPGVQTVNVLGFDCFYTASMGFINDDEFLDVLIQDPSEGYYPAIRDFVLIQQADGSLELEDAVSYKLPDLTSIQSTLVLAELNADRSRDLVLLGLSDYIPGVNDQIIFAPVCELCTFSAEGELPKQYVDVGLDFVSFFDELDQWIRSFNGNYFDENAPTVSSVPELTELTWMTDSDGNIEFGKNPLLLDIWKEECGANLVRCYSVLADESDIENSTIYESHLVSYSTLDYQIEIADRENDPEEPDYYFVAVATFSEQRSQAIKDYSGFNQDALRLAQNELGQIREAGVMWYPSREADAIYTAIREYLGNPVFYNSVHTASLGKYSLGIEFEHMLSREIVGSVQRVVSFITQRFVRERFD